MNNVKYFINGNKIEVNLDILKGSMKTGGQGDVYLTNQDYCIKVLHNPDAFQPQLDTITKIIRQTENPYEQIKSVAAVPRSNSYR